MRIFKQTYPVKYGYFLDGPDVKISWVDQREGGSSVREGENLELKCEVAANPPHHTILWYREVSNAITEQ